MNNLDEKVISKSSESEFSSKSILSLFWKYSMFALAGLIFQAFSLIADGFFVGNGIGPAGLATISIIVPFWILSVALYGLLGIGSSTIAAIKLGNGDREGAREVYGKTIIFSLVFSVALSILLLFTLDSVLVGLGATKEILPYAREYVIPFIIGLPICLIGNIAYFFVRLAEKPLLGALSFIIPAFLAIVIEYCMIYKLKMGMAGSAIPWVICVGTTVLIIPYLQFSNSIFKIKISDFNINFKLMKDVSKIGFAFFAIQVSSTIATVLINKFIIKYGGSEIDIAAFGIINAYIAYLLALIVNAFITGIQPIASYNIGAKLYKRVVKLISIGITQSTLTIIAAMILIFIFADTIIGFFAGPVPELITVTKEIMNVYLLLFAFGNLSQIAAGYYMSVEQNGLAILNGISRVLLFAVPLLLLMPNIFGLKGIWMAQPVSDGIAFIMAFILLKREQKRLMDIENTNHECCKTHKL